jgi:putative transposase
MLKAIKVRIYLDKNQQIYVGKLFGCYRYVYNTCLAKKIESYKTDKTNLNLKHLGNYFHNDLTKNQTYLTEHNTKVLKQSIINMLDAYSRFFKSKKGFPKFKSKHDSNQSVRFPVEAISKINNFDSNRLNLTKDLKNIKFKTSDKYHKYLNKYQNCIKSATLTKTPSGKFFLSILINSDEVIKAKKPINDFIGLDLGIKDFVVTSNGEVFENIKTIRNNSKSLVKLHRQLSRKVNGSNNKNKTRIKLAKKYETLNNIKNNYLHLISNRIIDENQVIVIEDLNVKGMLKNRKLSKAIQELSLYKFKTLLKYKAEWNGRNVIEIDRFFPSSKLCSECGYKYSDLTLKEREWVCPQCGTHHHRDLNAAINIMNEGRRIFNEENVGFRKPELTLVDCQDNSNLFEDRMKQENQNNSNCISLCKFD